MICEDVVEKYVGPYFVAIRQTAISLNSTQNSRRLRSLIYRRWQLVL